MEEQTKKEMNVLMQSVCVSVFGTREDRQRKKARDGKSDTVVLVSCVLNKVVVMVIGVSFVIVDRGKLDKEKSPVQ